MAFLEEKGWEKIMPIGILTPYLRNKRRKLARQYIKGDVLDLGCGKADIYTLCKDNITHYTGVDLDGEILKGLRAQFPEADFYQYNFDEDALHFERKYDCILMIGLIEHLYNQKYVMQEVKKWLKPEGVIVITTPTPLGNDLFHRYGSKMRLFSQSAADDHVVIYNKKRFEILAKDLGFLIVRYKLFQFGGNQLVVLKNKN